MAVTERKYSDTQKFVQNIDRHLLESITNSQKNSVFHEGFDSIIRFLNASTFYGLLTPCTNFGVWLQNVMSAKIRNGLGGNCQWPVSMFETNVIEASGILCRNFRSALYKHPSGLEAQ